MEMPTETRRIGAHEYTVAKLGFWEWKQLFTRLSKILSPALAGRDFLETNASEIIALAVTGLASDDGTAIIETLGRLTTALENGKKLPLTAERQDGWWPVNSAEFLPWLTFALEVQFRDFLAGIQGLGIVRAAKQDE